MARDAEDADRRLPVEDRRRPEMFAALRAHAQRHAARPGKKAHAPTPFALPRSFCLVLLLPFHGHLAQSQHSRMAVHRDGRGIHDCRAVAGHGVAEKINPTRLEQLIGFNVLDNHHKKVGTVEAVWQDHTGDPAFLGVKTGWLGLGKQHIIPAYSAECNTAKKEIRVPFNADVVKDAPSFDSQADINEGSERSIYNYYKQHGLDWDQSRMSPQESQRPINEDARMTLKKEELNVGKREVDAEASGYEKLLRLNR